MWFWRFSLDHHSPSSKMGLNACDCHKIWKTESHPRRDSSFVEERPIIITLLHSWPFPFHQRIIFRGNDIFRNWKIIRYIKIYLKATLLPYFRLAEIYKFVMLKNGEYKKINTVSYIHNWFISWKPVINDDLIVRVCKCVSLQHSTCNENHVYNIHVFILLYRFLTSITSCLTIKSWIILKLFQFQSIAITVFQSQVSKSLCVVLALTIGRTVGLSCKQITARFDCCQVGY